MISLSLVSIFLVVANCLTIVIAYGSNDVKTGKDIKVTPVDTGTQLLFDYKLSVNEYTQIKKILIDIDVSEFKKKLAKFLKLSEKYFINFDILF